MFKKIISCRLFTLMIALTFVLQMINLPVLASEPETEVEEGSVEVHYAEEAEMDFSHDMYLGDIYECDEDEFDSDEISLQDAEEELNAKYKKLDRAFKERDNLIENEPHDVNSSDVISLASIEAAENYTLGSTVNGTTGTGGQTQYRFTSPDNGLYTFRINQPVAITL